jgi:hypothetical protein
MTKDETPPGGALPRDATRSARRQWREVPDFDPTAAFLAGDYVELCPRCGSPATTYVDDRYGCNHCGMEWAGKP